MKRLNIETAVGMFMLVGFLCFAYLAVKLGDVTLFGGHTYPVKAKFVSISGLKEGAPVEIAGVNVGKVSGIRLLPEDYEAEVTLAMNRGITLQEDSIASVRTYGIIGDKYIDISPGGSEETIQPGGEIVDTESALILEKLIGKYIYEKK